MDTLNYDVIILIFNYLDLKSLVNLLNCNNKYIYENLMNYIVHKKIYKDIIRYDLERYKRFGKLYYTDFLQYGSKFRKLVYDGISRFCIGTLYVFPETLEVIRLGCSLDILKHIKNNVFYTEDLLCATIFNENIKDNTENLNWLKSNGSTITQIYLEYAAAIGNLTTMKWLFDNIGYCYLADYSVFEAAAINGNIENMKWLREKGFNWNYKTFTGAALNGNLHNMIWLKENGCPSYEYGDTFLKAVVNGNIENMIWLIENNVGISEISFAYPAQLGNLDIMKWMKEAGFPLSEDIFLGAIKNYDIKKCFLPIFTHPHSGINLFKRKNSTIEILEWLKENNCPMSSDAYDEAKRHDNVEIIKWLKDNGCPTN